MIAPPDQVGQDVALLTLSTQAEGTEEGADDEDSSCVLHDARRRCQLHLTRLELPKNVTTCVASVVAEVCLSADSVGCYLPSFHLVIGTDVFNSTTT